MKKFLVFALLSLCLTCRAGFCDAPDYKPRAVAALKKGDTKGATQIALDWLKAKAPDDMPLEKRDGDAVHDANQILGLAALAEKRVPDAKRYLVAAGMSPGSTQLELWGPNMHLAQDLLNMGESGIVVAYLNLVLKFWGNIPDEHRKVLEATNKVLLNNIDYLNQENQDTMNNWIYLIRDGKKPMLNHSYDY